MVAVQQGIFAHLLEGKKLVVLLIAGLVDSAEGSAADLVGDLKIAEARVEGLIGFLVRRALFTEDGGVLFKP